MEIESTLRILAGIAQFEQIEDRLDIRVKPVITLAGKRNVAIRQFRYGLSCISIQFALRWRLRLVAGFSPLSP